MGLHIGMPPRPAQVAPHPDRSDGDPPASEAYARKTIKSAPIFGVRSTDEFWTEFSGRFKPRLIEQMLTAEHEGIAEKLVNGLMGTPQQFNLVADSPDIAIAFAVAAIRSANADVREFLEARTLTIDTVEGGRELIGRQNLIFFLRGEAARAPASFAEAGPTLVALARRQRITEGEMVLPRQSNHAMAQALEAMDVDEVRANTLARGCGGSLSALGRQIPGDEAPTRHGCRTRQHSFPLFSPVDGILRTRSIRKRWQLSPARSDTWLMTSRYGVSSRRLMPHLSARARSTR